jgi:alpha-ketoglutarate-dependent taurine dioxygenase
MAYETIEVRKLSPHIGAEIHGVDLSQPLGNQQFQEIHDALLDRLVIFFRDQNMSVERHMEFGRRFGKLHTHPAAPVGIPEHPEVFVLKADENSTSVAGEDWHSDVTCDPVPPMGSILHLLEIPPDGGGDTLFANMYLAYETLSEPIRRLIDGLTAVHDGERVYRDRYAGGKSGGTFPRAEHPVVRTHPVTGRKVLFVNRYFTSHIVGLRSAESEAILSMLYRQVETPELSLRFKWQRNSVAFWDNRCAQHRALWDYYPHRRFGHRVTICGDKPF